MAHVRTTRYLKVFSRSALFLWRCSLHFYITGWQCLNIATAICHERSAFPFQNQFDRSPRRTSMMIPNHPSSKPLDISDKPELDRLFAELQPQVSELTFANLYLFRKAHDYQLGRIGGSLIVTGCGYDGNRYCLPPLGGDMKEALTALSNDKMTIYGADESLAQHCRDTHIADCTCLLYTSPSPRDGLPSRMPSSA